MVKEQKVIRFLLVLLGIAVGAGLRSSLSYVQHFGNWDFGGEIEIIVMWICIFLLWFFEKFNPRNPQPIFGIKTVFGVSARSAVDLAGWVVFLILVVLVSLSSSHVIGVHF